MQYQHERFKESGLIDHYLTLDMLYGNVIKQSNVMTINIDSLRVPVSGSASTLDELESMRRT